MHHTCETVSGPIGFTDLCALDLESSKAQFSSTTGDWSLNTTDYNHVIDGEYKLNITEHAGDLSSVHAFSIELIHPCFLIPMKVSEHAVEKSLSVNFGDDPIIVDIPKLESECKELTV